ncbi:Type IV pilus biogenesis protein PilN [Minicystis rosea]|nr:Type IV pilus biogenesis protein PilN [Minicystis rosea]
MIRVNLLPQKRGARNAPPPTNQKWLLVVLGVLVVEVVILFLFHKTKLDELEEQKNVNQQLNGKIDGIKKLVANHEEIKKALVQLRAREDAIAKLQAARSGPTAVLLELTQVLTQGKGPTADPERLQQLRKENPLAVYNPGWDTRRLWLNGYTESDRVVRIDGIARDGGDVSEFAQRLKLSVYFYDITVLPGQKDSNKDAKLELVNFALQMKVRY